jgi:cobyrinic acid a,c-diamide synthase
MHAEKLAANRTLMDDVARFARDGGPVVAECAGLLYLGRSLDGVPMTDVLPMTGEMTKRLTLGYRRATAVADGPLSRAGEQVTGHEFHRTAVTWDRAGTGETGTAAWTWPLADGTEATEGWSSPNLHASYLHVHWAGHPAHAVRLVAAAEAFAASVLV